MPEHQSSEATSSSQLARELSAPMLAIYGAGTILGAGIYVLIGKVIGEAGLWTPLAFLIAALVAAVNGLVYAELSTRSPRAGGPTDYVAKAFDRRSFAIVIGWMIVVTGLVSAATIATGFSGYLSLFVEMPTWLSRAGLLVILGTLAALGAKESAWFMAATTTLGILGLLYVMGVGFLDPGSAGAAGMKSYLAALPPLGEAATATGVLAAAFLAVYSFIGFEDIVHMAEEVKKPAHSIPFAIVAALTAAAILYVLVSFAALRIVPPDEIAASEAPLVTAVRKAGYPDWPLGLLSLWIILNGALAQIIMATRVIYGLGQQRGGAPALLSKLNPKTHTPLAGTAAVVIVTALLAVFLPLATLASITSFVMLLVFAASNAALIVLERRRAEAPFDVPVFLPWLGLALCLALLIGKVFFGGGH